MTKQPTHPERIRLAPDLEISRLITGLWQVADMERDGKQIDLDAAARAMAAYAAAGFDSFDMADHYGSAEDITGRFNQLVAAGKVASKTGARPTAFTKWCPTPTPMTAEIAQAAVQRACDRMATDRIDLMQFHWWMFEHPAYLDALRELAALKQAGRIGHLGLTNFDTDHLRLLVKHGIPILSNQVCFSLLDRRAAEDLSSFCLESGVKLFAYGTLAGGLLTETWLNKPEPQVDDITDWSKMKYKRFVDQIGGWQALQAILQALATIGRKHHVSIANVATRWVLEQPAVAAIIVGARLGEREHRADNLALFSFALDLDDHALIDAALLHTRRIPGDCGQEYRRPPYLTASGDLSHHLEGFPKVFKAVPVPGRPNRQRIDSGSIWEPLAGYSRAVRHGDRILVSGTTATHGSGEIVCQGDVAGQTTYILDKIAASISALGGSLEDVVRTRVYLRDRNQWEAASRVHGHYFGDIRPANTLIEIADLVGDYEVEIEAEAIVG
jgi:aryl-alcohol dehydrogenase-like predicted oxidoreductase/enamine deaminase RidA (YjgF/YER057c/UK114 family)